MAEDDAKRSDTQMVTVRLPLDDYETLRDCSFYTGRSMNELVTVAVRTLMAEYARKQDLVKRVEAAARKTKQSFKRLGDS